MRVHMELGRFRLSDPYEPIHALLRAGNFAAALAALHDVEADTIKPPFDDDPIHGWYVIGDIYFKSGNIRSALAAFKECLGHRMDDVDAMWAIADCYFELNDLSMAETFLRHGLRLQPENQGLLYDLANVQFDQQDYEGAIKSYALIDGSDPEIHAQATKNRELAELRLQEHRATEE